MTDSPFIHLGVRSSYSLLESMITPEALADWAVAQSMPALAVSDPEQSVRCAGTLRIAVRRGIQPIMACCFDLGARSRATRFADQLYAQDETGIAG